eukprot:gene8009-8657_t
MGGFSSKSSNALNLKKSEEEVVKLMFPVYYCDDMLTTEEDILVERAWNLVLTDGAFSYRLKAQRSHSSCIAYFYELFYNRLFDVHPGARDLFKDIQSQGKFLVKMISLGLSEKVDQKKYTDTLTKLAEIHNERGVKAVEYGIVGEVLFWTLRAILGPQEYSNELNGAWVKIYSRMLRVMVPIAIAYELKDGSAQEKRFFAQTIGLSCTEEKALVALEKKTVPSRPAIASVPTVEESIISTKAAVVM